MQTNLLPPIDVAGKVDARADWLDRVLDQLGHARDLTDMLGIPGLSQRTALAQADATRLRRR